MDILDISKTLSTRLNCEVSDAEKVAFHFKDYFTKPQIKKMAFDRGFGMVLLAQDLGLPYEVASAMYEDFKEKVEKVVDKN